MTRFLVAGATGFVGTHLTEALVAEGHDVKALTRRPDDYDGAGRPVGGDVEDDESLAQALRGREVAYYLVHALGDDDFEDRDGDAALAFSKAAHDAGIRQIIYLSGLGPDDVESLPPHLRSRREVEDLLRTDGVPVTVLRAAVVVGDGGISWELTRQIAGTLPVFVVPLWAKTLTQPVALDDVIRYLKGVVEHPDAIGQTFDIGGPEPMSYLDMLTRAARVINGRRTLALAVPTVPPSWLARVIATAVRADTTTVKNLIGSMSTEVVVNNPSIRTVVPGAPLTYEESVRRALAASSE